MEFRSLKLLGLIAFITFCFVWAWISIANLKMYIPPVEVVSGLLSLIGGRLFQTYAENSKTKSEEEEK